MKFVNTQHIKNLNDTFLFNVLTFLGMNETEREKEEK